VLKKFTEPKFIQLSLSVRHWQTIEFVNLRKEV